MLVWGKNNTGPIFNVYVLMRRPLNSVKKANRTPAFRRTTFRGAMYGFHGSCKIRLPGHHSTSNSLLEKLVRAHTCTT